MNQHIYLHYAFPADMLLLAGFFWTIAIRAWRFNHPFLISQRWMLGLMVIAFAPSFLNPFLFSHHHSREQLSLVIMQWLNPVMLVALLVFFWFTMQGYTAFAITEKSFREAFLAAATKLGYTCEERLSSMHLLPVDVTVQVAVQSWMGTGMLRGKSRSNSSVIKSIGEEMNSYWTEHGGETNRITTGFYAVVGLFIIAVAVSMWVLKVK